MQRNILLHLAAGIPYKTANTFYLLFDASQIVIGLLLERLKRGRGSLSEFVTYWMK